KEVRSEQCADAGTRDVFCLGANAPLLDHLVGAREQRRRHIEAERLGGPHVDEQLDLRGLLDWQVDRFLAFENTASVDAGQTVGVRKTASIADEPAGRRELAKLIHRWYRVAERQRGQLFGPTDKETVSGDYKPACSQSRHVSEGRVELAHG